MSAAVQSSVTRAEYEAMPEAPPYYQLIEGQLVMSPSPLTSHQRVVGRLYSILSGYAYEQGIGEVFIAPLDVFLDDLNVYQPDIVFLSTARLHQVVERGIEGAPDLCVEVLSKSTQQFDKITKKKVFAQSGLKHYWLVDIEARNVTLLDLTADLEKPLQVVAAPETLRPKLFPTLKIPLAKLFQSV